MISNKPQRCKSMKPLDGCGASIILLSSSMMRSAEMILIRSLLRDKASKVSSSI